MPEVPIEDLQKRVAARIRELARSRRIPITHLADRAGVSRGHLWNVLNGIRAPTIEWLLHIANTLDVDVAELFRAPGGGAAHQPARSRQLAKLFAEGRDKEALAIVLREMRKLLDEIPSARRTPAAPRRRGARPRRAGPAPSATSPT